VKKAIFQFNLDKAPGIDGYNAHFLQKHWKWGKTSLRQLSLFFQYGALLKEINHTLLTPVPNARMPVPFMSIKPSLAANYFTNSYLKS